MWTQAWGFSLAGAKKRKKKKRDRRYSWRDTTIADRKVDGRGGGRFDPTPTFAGASCVQFTTINEWLAHSSGNVCCTDGFNVIDDL